MKTLIAIAVAGLVSTSAFAQDAGCTEQMSQSAKVETQRIYSSESLRKSIRQSALSQLRYGKQQLAMHPVVSDTEETEIAYRETKSETEQRVRVAL